MSGYDNVSLSGIRGVIEAKIGMCMMDALKRVGQNLAPKDPRMTALGPEGDEMRLGIIRDLRAQDIDWPTLPMAAAEFKRQGDLGMANTLYATYCLVEEPYDKSYIWPWMKVLFLAKNFEEASLLLTYLYTFNVRYNLMRLADGESLSDYAAWGSKPPVSFDDYSPSQFLRQVSDRQLASRDEVEEAIQAYGGSDYWRRNFYLSYSDYQEFCRYF